MQIRLREVPEGMTVLTPQGRLNKTTAALFRERISDLGRILTNIMPSRLSGIRLVAWLCLVAAAVGLVVAVLALWTSFFGLMTDTGSVEGLALGCVAEAAGMLVVGLVLLDGFKEPDA